MTLRKMLSVLTVLFLLAEPALALVPLAHNPSAACSTCGMKGTCGIVCCCHPHAHEDLAPSKTSRLFPMGCHQDKDSAALDSTHTPRWTPEVFHFSPPLLFPNHSIPFKNILPTIPEDVPTPPPNLGLLP